MFKRRNQILTIMGIAAFTMAASAGTSTVTFNTNAAGTGFSASGLTLNSLSGAAATLTFMPDATSTVGTPSNVNFGNFTLVCATCSTQATGAGAVFGAFAFDLLVTDVTDSAIGKFVGTSSGGTVFSDVSPLTLLWAPAQLGPGMSNAMSGSFSSAAFSLSGSTAIVAPASGAIPGQSTVQGFVSAVAVPEPASIWLMGLAGLGLMAVRRRRPHR